MVYYVLLGVIAVTSLFANFFKNRKLAYCIVVSIAFILFAGLRSQYVGVDTYSYINVYFLRGDIIWEQSLEEIFSQRDLLFWLYRSVVKFFTENYTWLLMPIAVLYISAVTNLVYKYSKTPLLSYVALISMSYYAFSMTGLRQTIGYAILMFALDKIIERKYVFSAVLILLASGFHISCSLFFVVFLINLLPLNFIYVMNATLLSVVSFLFGPTIISIGNSLLWEADRYSSDEYGGTTVLLVLILVAVAALLFYPSPFKKEPLIKNEKGKLVRTEKSIDQFFIKMLLASIPIQVLVIYQANIFRVAAMFHICIIALIPNVIKKQNSELSINVSNVAVIGIFLIELFFFTFEAAGVMPYTFFWEALTI